MRTAVRPEIRALFESLPLSEEEEMLLLSYVSASAVLRDRRILVLLGSIRNSARKAALNEYRDKYLTLYKNYGTTSPLFIAVAYAFGYKSGTIKAWAHDQYNTSPESHRFIPIKREDSSAVFLLTCLMVVEMGYAGVTIKSVRELTEQIVPLQKRQRIGVTHIKYFTKTFRILIKHGWVRRIYIDEVNDRLPKYPKLPKSRGHRGAAAFYIPTKDGLDLYGRINEEVVSKLETIRKW